MATELIKGNRKELIIKTLNSNILMLRSMCNVILIAYTVTHKFVQEEF